MINPAHKVTLSGDSHIKGLAIELRALLTSDYELFSVVKLGSGTKVLRESITETVEHLTNEDILVISSGTNDYDCDNFKSTFSNLKEYLSSVTHANILVLGIPYRYDLRNSKAINTEILKINRKLSKMICILPNISFIESNNDTKLFTKHGLHRNKLGKQHIVTQLASHIFSVFSCISQVRTPLTWYEPIDDSLNKSNAQLVERPIDVPQDETCTKNVMRNSSRLRKTPVTRSNEFLW